MKSLELFAGIGGIALAEQMAGIEVAGLCEYADYPRAILQKHWPDVPLFKDVKKLDRKELTNAGIDPDSIDIISGGFPCQPFSSAGKRQGTADDRDLWPEMFRIIQQLWPTWVVGENVANFANMELDRTLNDLEGLDYQTRAFILPAEAIGALHRRQRTFIVARTSGKRQSSVAVHQKSRSRQLNHQGDQDEAWRQTWAKQERVLLAGREVIKNRVSDIHRIDDGLPEELDRFKALGNAVVPQQILPIFKAIVQIEEDDQ
ncbi:DNA cytosine methyltransferase [Lacticaseibacillus paracasei]|uniref:DNA cytosine methyltransferase n=1 Tax=Lacticaseibacillus paracasei TaxID=1597 RepID=UPI002620377B|nr:DNA cytosine methyltransferase [Lacticaseibacillus paracasei]MDN4554653.1 DNA cytosine methyltransferase [Lacticaseibacillus paracasei]